MKITRETWAALYRSRTAHPCGNLLSHGTGSFGEKRHPAKSALHESSPTLARARSNAVTRRSTNRIFVAFNYMDGRWPKGAALVLEIRRAVSQPGSTSAATGIAEFSPLRN